MNIYFNFNNQIINFFNLSRNRNYKNHLFFDKFLILVKLCVHLMNVDRSISL